MKILGALFAFLSVGPAAHPRARRLDAAFDRQERARSGKLAAVDSAIAAESRSRAWIEKNCAETRRKREDQESRWPAGRTTTLRNAAASLPDARPTSTVRDDIEAMLASLDAPRKKSERP